MGLKKTKSAVCCSHILQKQLAFLLNTIDPLFEAHGLFKITTQMTGASISEIYPKMTNVNIFRVNSTSVQIKFKNSKTEQPISVSKTIFENLNISSAVMLILRSSLQANYDVGINMPVEINIHVICTKCVCRMYINVTLSVSWCLSVQCTPTARVSVHRRLRVANYYRFSQLPFDVIATLGKN